MMKTLKFVYITYGVHFVAKNEQFLVYSSKNTKSKNVQVPR